MDYERYCKLTVAHMATILIDLQLLNLENFINGYKMNVYPAPPPRVGCNITIIFISRLNSQLCSSGSVAALKLKNQACSTLYPKL